MQYLINLADAARRFMVVLALREIDVKRSAADFVFDVLGSTPADLVESGVIAQGQADDLSSLQAMIFDKDDQGYFIRDNVSLTANGKPFDPDASMISAFVAAERDATPYMRCDLAIEDGTEAAGAPAAAGAAAAAGTAAGGDDAKQKLDQFARMMFIHQIATGFAIDVTKDIPELMDSIAEAEKHNWIDIDTQKAAYRLTPEGLKMHQAYMAEAQDLLKRYDIYGDVDIDSGGTVRFDTGLGKDYRVAVFDFERIDPFRARFLIGLNDGEWDQLSNWPELYRNSQWYEYAMDDVARAPSVDEIGREQLRRILDAGKTQLRMDSRLR